MGDRRTRIGLIHATVNSLQPIANAFHEHSPDVQLLHFMDEGLIDELNETGVITEGMIRRLMDLVGKAEQSRVDGILLTCSSFSPYVKQIRPFFTTPLLAADISMLEQAVDNAARIGVIATVEAAGPTTTGLIKEIAEERKKQVEVHTEVLTEAFTALQQGNRQKHNELIQSKIKEMSAHCELVVLAQMSMTTALQGMPPASVPVLTSPEISVKAILSKVTTG
jgi:Asp/Glu/hydantoin racemase